MSIFRTRSEISEGGKVSAEAGMTLIEVIAVIVLITLIAVTVGKNVFTSSSAAKAKLNVTKMNSMKGVLVQYRLQYNVYPARLEDLIKPSAEAKKSGELFTPLIGESELKDIYGTNYSYTQAGNGRSYVLKSLGEDGAEGGDGVNQDVEMRP